MPALLAGCSQRLEPPKPETYANTDVVSAWSQRHAEPYQIPERALRAYAYAAHHAEEQGCSLGWPTIAALGAVLSDHGQAQGSSIGDDGVTTKELRGLNLAHPEHPVVVPDTDRGRVDGDERSDVPVGPMQIMPSRWDQYATAAENGATPSIHNIDDASVTVSGMLCASGNLEESASWDRAITGIDPDPEFVKAVHAKAEEYSR